MIIFTVVTCHIPVTVIDFLINSPNGGYLVKVYNIYEPAQLTTFAIQEIIISGMYIYYTTQILRLSQEIRGHKAKVIFWRLIYINLFVIILDVTLLSLQYLGYDQLQHFYKAAVYSIKLKMEFIILNQLLEVTRCQNFELDSYQQTRSQHITESDNFEESSKQVDNKEIQNGHSTLAGTNNITFANMKHYGIRDNTGVVLEYARSSKSHHAEDERKC